MFLAQQRSAPDLTIVTAVLQRWHTEPAPDDDRAIEVRELLDRLVLATQLRFAAVGDLARSVRFRWFDQPVVDREREEALAGVPAEVEYLADHPEAPDRAERMDALAAIPERIVSFLSERLQDGVPVREPLLEVLIRRHYREYELHDLQSLQVDDRPVTIADYVLDNRPTHLVSTMGTFDELDPTSSLSRAIEAQVAARAPDQQGVVDLYLAWPDAPAGADDCFTALLDRFATIPFARDVRRVAVGVCRPGVPVSYFTLRPGDDGLYEDEPVRGLHPMVGRRLDLWRLRDFEITRLDAPEDVLLYHCVARDNGADQRLVALTQVRELAVVRDDEDRVSSLPQVERAIANCVEAIRRARALHATRENALDMNHVWVHIWPPIEAELDQLTSLRRNIAPHHRGRRHRRGARAGQGRRGRRLRPGGRPVLLPARRRRAVLGEPAADRAAQADGRLRPEGRARAASRHDLPLRDPRDGRGRRAARSSSTTSTTPAGWCRSTVRRA